MQVPLEISFRDVPKSSPVERLLQRRVEKLQRICSHMTSCRVAVERPHRFESTGSPYRVRLDIRVPPGHEVVVTREPGEGDLHDDLTVVMGDAFDAAERSLKRLVDQQRRDVKSHPAQETGAMVDKLFRNENYGFLKDLDGRDIYFHRNSVLNNDFDRLEVGTGVRFAAELGEEGLQATTVKIVDKPGVRSAKADEPAEI